MKQIQFPQTYDNETAHRQVKRLMMLHKQLHIQMNGEAWISSQGTTGIKYLLDEQSWHWILNYLQTGDYEDFGIFPSDISRMAADTQLTCLQELIEQKCNIARIPFLRETEAFVKLRALFRFGKLYFSIKRSDEFMDYLNSKGL